MCSFLLASSFSPRRRDLHAKVRAEILIGRAALYKSTYTPAEKTGKKERETCETEQERERDRESKTSSEIIHYVPGYNVAHLKQWQMRESGRIIRKNGILLVGTRIA